MRVFRNKTLGFPTAALLILWQLTSAGWSLAESAETPKSPPYLSSAEAAKQLPATLSPETFADPQVARAYRIAKIMPEVLAQQPCLCWCNRIGHRSLLSCYTNDHASLCDVCMKEAFMTESMTKSRHSPAQIRDAIVRGEWKNAK